MQSRLKELPDKIMLLESIQPLEYHDFELLSSVKICPLRLREKVKGVKRDIEANYRKRYG